MLSFPCPSCGKPVQADDAFAGKQVLCPVCNLAMTAPPPSTESAITTREHAPPMQGSASREGTFREGSAPREPLPSLRKDAPQIVIRWVPLVVVAGLLLTGVALWLPASHKAICASERTITTNNLKNILLGFHSFHDQHKRLPFNGTRAAAAGDFASGSWAFQILPFIDYPNLFANPQNRQIGIHAYTDAWRARPPCSTTGAWSDFFINVWLNDPINGAVNAPDAGRTLKDISDGESNTIFVGQGSIDPGLYATETPIAQSSDIFTGGKPGTARRSLINRRDTAGNQELTWGGPYSQGALMGMGDVTVRLFAYDRYSGEGDTLLNGHGNGSFAPLLTPAGGEEVNPPD
jgi:hypothetical protein